MDPYLSKKRIGLLFLTFCCLIVVSLIFKRYSARKPQHNNSPIRLYEQYREIFVDLNCPVKAKSSGIYHLPGDSFYNRISGDFCFNNQEEAEEAGFKVSGQ